MKDLKKLYNYLTKSSVRVLEELTLCIDENKRNLVTLNEIADNANTEAKEVRRTLKILQLIEMLEYESLGNKGTIIEVIDKELFNRIKEYIIANEYSGVRLESM